MQPYLFPYLGYFSLVSGCERFVFYDDVQFIKNGWINRNRILVAGRPAYFTVPLADASPNVAICDVHVAPGDHWRRKLLEMLRHSYARAPFYAPVAELVRAVLCSGEARIAEMAKASVRAVAAYLHLPAQFVATSGAYGNANLRSADRVLDICAREGATQYVNLPGGTGLYDAQDFRARGIELRFVQPRLEPYPQFGAAFVPALSIIDAMMHNAPDAVRRMAQASEAAPA